MEEPTTTTLLTPTALSSMKRSELQKLCKKYGLKANGKNTDLQKKLKQYALNSGGNIDMEDIEMMDVDCNPDIDKSSQRNQYADSISEPTTPQTPSAIPLEQQNKVRSSLVDDSPINIKASSQHEIKEIEIGMVTNESRAGDLVSINTVGQCLSLIPYKEPIFSNLAKEPKEQEGNMTESKIEEMEHVNIKKSAIDTDNIDDTLKIVEMQITEHLVSGEKNDLNTIPMNPAFEQVEMNKPHVMANIFVSPLNPSSNLIPVEPRTLPSKHIRSVETERASTNLMARLTATPVIKSGVRTNSLSGSCHETKAGPALDKNSPFITRETNLNFETMQNSLPIQEEESRDKVTENEGDPMDIYDEQSKSKETADIPLSNNENITASVYKEMENRVAQLRALPSPERKKILGIDNAKNVVTPFSKNSEASLINQTSSSSANRFTQVHEKVFSQMPSIVTHYAAQKTKKGEEIQDEVNRKRKDPDSVQPSFKKQKLAHSTQGSQVTKTTKDVYKKVEKDKVVKSIVKKTYDRNRTTNNNRSSMRLLAKSKNVSQTEVQPGVRTSSRFNVQESLKKSLSYVPYKRPINLNPDEQRKKEREELEKRKQAARNVAQPVLEKMKNQRKTKENVEQKPRELQNTRNVKIEEKKSKVPSLLPKRA